MFLKSNDVVIEDALCFDITVFKGPVISNSQKIGNAKGVFFGFQARKRQIETAKLLSF